MALISEKLGADSMLTKQQIRDDAKRRGWIVLPYLVFGLAAILVYLLLIGIFFKPSPDETMEIVLVLPLFALFLVPLVLGVRRAGRIQTLCPSCHKNMNGRVQRVLRTRQCPECGVKIVEGPEVTEAVQERHRVLVERYQLRFMRYWVWVWPAMSLFVIGAEWLFPGSQLESEAFLWMPGVLGAVSSGWMLVRGKERSALLPLVVSMVLMGIGGWMFLQ